MEDTELVTAAPGGIDAAPEAPAESPDGSILTAPTGSAEALVARFHAMVGNVRAHVPHAINGDVRACGAAIAALLDLVEALLGATKPAG